MIKGKTVLVTSGGTQEYIDNVRVITNTSTGTTGATIAIALAKAGANVHYIHGLRAVVPLQAQNLTNHEVVTVNDAIAKISSFKDVSAVVHAMAVSDFTFERDDAVKCKSSDAEAFIEYMRQTIRKTPKIIHEIKHWYPGTVLVGFKYEVGKSFEDLCALAQDSITTNGCDLVVANDEKEIRENNSHIAYFIYSENSKAQGKCMEKTFETEKVLNNDEIAEKIVMFLDCIQI